MINSIAFAHAIFRKKNRACMIELDIAECARSMCLTMWAHLNCDQLQRSLMYGFISFVFFIFICSVCVSIRPFVRLFVVYLINFGHNDSPKLNECTALTQFCIFIIFIWVISLCCLRFLPLSSSQRESLSLSLGFHFRICTYANVCLFSNCSASIK